MTKSKPSTNNVTITVYFFKMDGCGHCEHLKPIWDSVVEEMSESHPAIIFKEVESNDIPKLPDDIRTKIKADTIKSVSKSKLENYQTEEVCISCQG